VLSGNGLHKYADVFADALGARASTAAEYLWDPSGHSLLATYSAMRERGELGDGDAAGVLPVYTRLSDAEENEQTRSGGAPR
jgi:N6-L-threonylcarbamoyladenine synthase